MLRQIVNGKSVRTVNVTGSTADLTTLKSVMEGEIEEWAVKSSGGTTSDPSILNYIGFSVGRIGLNGVRRSESIFLPHVKPTKSFSDIRTAVVAVWDESFTSASACEYANPYNMKSEA